MLIAVASVSSGVRVAKVGRPSSYTPERGATVCKLIEEGHTTKAISAMPGQPSWDAIRNWIRDFPEFASQYARAREVSGEAIEAQIREEIAAAHDKDSAAVARVRVDALKWIAAKRAPKIYGDRIQADVSGKLSLEALVTAAVGALEQPTIEGQIVPESDDDA